MRMRVARLAGPAGELNVRAARLAGPAGAARLAGPPLEAEPHQAVRAEASANNWGLREAALGNQHVGEGSGNSLPRLLKNQRQRGK